MRFVDTNVLLYAVSTDSEEVAKAAAARTLLNSEDLGLSVQVLQEFYVQSTRPGRKDALTHEQAATLVESFLRFRVQENTVALTHAAIETCHKFQVSYWDAAILEAARALGCVEALSEDLNDGQDYGGVVVVNPFRGMGKANE